MLLSLDDGRDVSLSHAHNNATKRGSIQNCEFYLFVCSFNRRLYYYYHGFCYLRRTISNFDGDDGRRRFHPTSRYF